ncbi:MAG: cohesin domain-containing protein [Acutalibacteraceae bacterium]
MNKRVLGVILSVAMIMTAMLSIMSIQVSAASTAEITLSSASARMGEEVEVAVSITENSYMVNADMVVTYDATKLQLVADAYDDPIEEGEKSCYTVSDGFYPSSFMYKGSSPMDGVFKFAVVTGGDSGLAKGGELFRLKFKIIADDVESTTVNFSASPFCGNDGTGEKDENGYPIDFNIEYTVVPAVVTIIDANPTTTTTAPEPQLVTEWLLKEEYITSGRENVTINADGTWTVTGPVQLTPNVAYDYNELPYLSQSFSCGVPYKIVINDTPNNHEIGLYANWFGPDYFPAGTYISTFSGSADSMKGVYDWNIAHGGWANTNGKANITTIDITLDGNGSLKISSLALCSEAVVVSAPSAEGTTTTDEETTTTTTAPAGVLGDMNDDGTLDVSDSLALYMYVSGQQLLTTEQKALADVDRNGTLDLADALLLYRVVSGKMTL